MKISTVFLILALIAAVGVAGCTGGWLTSPAVPTTPVPSRVVVEFPETTAIPMTEATVAVPLRPTPVPVTTTLASASDITQHFLDVAYASANRLERLNYTSGQPRVVISSESASDEDIALIEKTARDFNDASPTIKLSENVKETGKGDIIIKYLSTEGLAAINLPDIPETGPFSEDLTRRELYQGSIPAAKILRGTIYINANLRSDAREHILVRSLMYELGLTGENTRFSDSVFYAGENTNVNLTPADKKIITILYTQEFYNGMNIDSIRRIMYLP